jgi:hypothetical protein
MKDTPQHSKVLEEIEKDCVPGLVKAPNKQQERFETTKSEGK